MWQRIQTLYLLLAAIVVTLFIFIPMVTLHHMNGETIYASINALGVQFADSFKFNLISFSLTALSALLSSVIIFLFKRRILQIRLSVINILINIAVIGDIAWTYYKVNQLEQTTPHLHVGLFLPLITTLLLFMAIRRISIDEALVRASNRLR